MSRWFKIHRVTPGCFKMSCLGSVASHGRHGAADRSEGKNLVLHEFAHQLDFEDFAADGVPALASRSDKLS
jgi:hypothetical protein